MIFYDCTQCRLQADYTRHPTVLTNTETSIIVSDLLPGTDYYFTVSAVNNAGEGVKSNIKSAKTLDSGNITMRKHNH